MPHAEFETVDLIVGRENCVLLSQGAEAVCLQCNTLLSQSPVQCKNLVQWSQRVWETTFCSRPTLVKERFSKKYRHPLLDVKLTVTRLKQVRASTP